MDTRPTILAVHRGRSPNCSATGSVVGLALLSVGAAAAILNAFADRFARWADDDDGAGGAEASPDPGAPDDPPSDPGIRVRREAFGGIVAWQDPPALLHVDHATTEAALAAGATPVGGRPAPAGALSAPTEAHLAVTDRCPVACEGCYLDAGPDRAATEPAAAELHHQIDELAELGVFEIALGGGEALLRDDVVDLAHRIRDRGMVPNLTISGFGLTPEKARALARVVGQVNVSLDGLDERYRDVRGWAGAPVGLRALRILREAGLRVGVNTVISRANVGGLEALAEALVAEGVSEWQWLRFKPAGRGAEAWEALAPTPEQLDGLWPRLLALEARTSLVLRIDCALVPFLVAHDPDPEAVERLALAGCPGGERLWARGADGRWAPCSFAHELVSPDARPLAAQWSDDEVLDRWRQRAAAPPEPCATCSWRATCRGGCRIVAHHLTGDALAPDPQCPRVRAWSAP